MSKRRKSNTGQTVKVGEGCSMNTATTESLAGQDDTAMDVTEQPDIGPVAAKVASLNQSLQAGLESMKQGGAEVGRQRDTQWLTCCRALLPHLLLAFWT